MLALLLSGDGTVAAPVTTRAQLPLLLAQATNLSTIPVGLAEETDTALPVAALLAGAAVVQVGIAEETDTALAVTISQSGSLTVPVGIPEETDTALSITPTASGAVFVAVGFAEETDTAFSVAYRQSFLGVVSIVPLALTPVVPDESGLIPVEVA